MLGTDRRVLQTAWTLFLFVFVLAAIYEVRRELVLFLFALFLANLLSPMVERVHLYRLTSYWLLAGCAAVAVWPDSRASNAARRSSSF